MNSTPITRTTLQIPPTKKRSNPSWVRIIFFLVTGLIAALGLYQLSDILQLLVISALFAYLLAPFVTWAESYGLNRNLATLAVFVVISIILFFSFLFLFPIGISQLSQLQTGPMIDQMEAIISDLEARVESPLARVGINDLDLITSLKTLITNFIRDTINYVPNVLAMLSNLVVVPFMMFFFIKDGHTIKKSIIDLVPNKYFEFSLNVLQKMDLQLGNYLRGQFLVAFVVGAMATIALWLLNVDFFLVIGPVAGLANMIPYLGPIIGLLPAILASLVTSGNFETVPAIVITFMGIQLIDNMLLQPLILAKNVELHPLLVLVAILAGGKLFGVIGLLLAVPFTAILKVIIMETITNMRRYHLS